MYNPTVKLPYNKLILCIINIPNVNKLREREHSETRSVVCENIVNIGRLNCVLVTSKNDDIIMMLSEFPRHDTLYVYFPLYMTACYISWASCCVRKSDTC